MLPADVGDGPGDELVARPLSKIHGNGIKFSCLIVLLTQSAPRLPMAQSTGD